MTGGNQRTPSRPPGQPESFTIWALHETCKKWLPIVAGLAGDTAITELTSDRTSCAGVTSRAD